MKGTGTGPGCAAGNLGKCCAGSELWAFHGMFKECSLLGLPHPNVSGDTNKEETK